MSLYKLLVAKLRMPTEMKNHDIFLHCYNIPLCSLQLTDLQNGYWKIHFFLFPDMP